MFDCVEKRSSLKNNINYNYEIKTSQDIKESKSQSASQDGYELSTNGKCPQYCSQCNEQGHCIKCKNDYVVVESTENGATKRNCKASGEVSIGYYENEGIYKKCIDNCKTCDSNGCIECEESFGLEENDNLNCKSIEDSFGEYYTIDGKSYWKCDGTVSNNDDIQRIPNCKKCEYNNGNLNCINCDNGYSIINHNTKSCIINEEINQTTYKYFKDDNNQ
jgi:hypothetical protein